MSELENHFERLMKFAKESGFHKPFSQVYFIEQKSILSFYNLNGITEVNKQNVFTIEGYKNRFDELLNQGYSWININFAGILNNELLVIIEHPNYENNSEFTSVNLSGPFRKVSDNNLNLSSFIKII